MSGRAFQVAWERSERGTGTVVDRSALLLAAEDCHAEHGVLPDALPPRAAVDAKTLPDPEVAAALTRLLACGHQFSELPGVTWDHANTLIEFGSWPPWRKPRTRLEDNYAESM